MIYLALVMAAAFAVAAFLFWRERRTSNYLRKRFNDLEIAIERERNPSHPNCRCSIVPIESTTCTRDVLLDGLRIPHRCFDDGTIEVRKAEVPQFVPYDLKGYFEIWEDPARPGIVILRRKTE